MKIITKPSVHVLAAPQFFDHPDYKLPPGGTAIDRIVAHAGKGCYDSYGEDGRSIAEHIHNLLQTRHGSVLEHANFTLFISGISRGLSHEFVRHRAGFAYSQRSTRYTNEHDAAIVLDPYYSYLYLRPEKNNTRLETKLLQRFIGQCEDALISYGEQVEWLIALNPEGLKGTALRKWARGKARQLLPHALETRMTVTGNIRAWRFFLEERGSAHAEPEIRRLAVHVLYTLLEHTGYTMLDVLETNGIITPEFKKV